MLADWRNAQIENRLRATLGFLEKITLCPREIDRHDVEELRRTGLTDRAILDATYVCVGFNIIGRIANALGFDIPSEELFSRAAKLLRVFGYKRLSGFWTNKLTRHSISPQYDIDPYAMKMTRLHHAVTSSPASLSNEVRQTITAGRNVPGPLGAYVRNVAEHAHEITDEDIASLHAAGYTDDEIFEATVSAALGAGLFRLDCVLRALVATQSISPAIESSITTDKPLAARAVH